MEYTIRRAVPEDYEVLTQARYQQLLDEGSEPVYDTRDEMRAYFKQALKDESLVQFIAEKDGAFLSTAGVVYQVYPPSISWRGGYRGYVTNVYTVPEHRHKGLSSALIKKCIEDGQARQVGCLWLLASPMGKGVYEGQGFVVGAGESTYMEWRG